MQEQWKPIPGYDGVYEASTHGRVRSVLRRVRGGRLIPLNPPLIRKENISKKTGRPIVFLTKNWKKTGSQTGKWILLSYVGKPPRGEQVRHLDGNPKNNMLGNLKYGSWSDNYADRVRHGTDASGEGNPNSRLKERDVVSIRQSSKKALADNGKIPRGFYARLAERYNVRRSTIRQAAIGSFWKGVA